MIRRKLLLLVIAAGAAGCGRRESSEAGSRPATSAAVSAPPLSAAPADSAPRAESTAPAADAVVRVDGPGLRRLIQERGERGALVNVWASWCGPCRRELPMLRSLSDNLKTRGLAVLLVSVDEPESETEMQRMLEHEGYRPPYYVVRRPLGPFKRALHPRWPGMIPATFLFDATGARRYFWGGPVHEHELVPIIDGFLAGETIDGEARYDLAPGQTTP